MPVWTALIHMSSTDLIRTTSPLNTDSSYMRQQPFCVANSVFSTSYCLCILTTKNASKTMDVFITLSQLGTGLNSRSSKSLLSSSLALVTVRTPGTDHSTRRAHPHLHGLGIWESAVQEGWTCSRGPERMWLAECLMRNVPCIHNPEWNCPCHGQHGGQSAPAMSFPFLEVCFCVLP